MQKPPFVQKKTLNNSWRKTAIAIFEKPVDGKLSGFWDFDMIEVSKALKEWNEQGNRVTIMHFFMAVMSRILAYHVPELNAYCQWGSVKQRENVTVSATVSIGGQEISMVKIEQAHLKSILEISKETNDVVTQRREGRDDKALSRRDPLAQIPWPFRTWLFRFMRWFVYEWGGSIPGSGFSKDMFGSTLVTNIGSIGLHYGVPALQPASNLSAVFAIGRIHDSVKVIDGEMQVRSIMPLSVTFDHRIVDGAHVGRILKAALYYFANPKVLLETDPPSAD